MLNDVLRTLDLHSQAVSVSLSTKPCPHLI